MGLFYMRNYLRMGKSKGVVSRESFLLTILFSSCNETPANKGKEEKKKDTTVIKSSNSMVVESMCFLYALNKDSTKIKLIISNNIVTGQMHWQPYQKDGAIGTFNGTKTGDTLTVNYDYMIEGNKQMEEKLFVLNGSKLIELQGALEDKNGKLTIKDKNAMKANIVLDKVDCGKIAF